MSEQISTISCEVTQYLDKINMLCMMFKNMELILKNAFPDYNNQCIIEHIIDTMFFYVIVWHMVYIIIES